MTFWRSCVGCVSQKSPCDARDALRASLKGLGITSVKWKCGERKPRFRPGDPVWAETVASASEHDDEGYPYRGDFPAVAIEDHGGKMLVFIEEGAAERHDEDLKFQPTKNGFCMIPLSRITARDGERQEICQSCGWPTSKGHQEGYICSAPLSGGRDDFYFGAAS